MGDVTDQSGLTGSGHPADCVDCHPAIGPGSSHGGGNEAYLLLSASERIRRGRQRVPHRPRSLRRRLIVNSLITDLGERA